MPILRRWLPERAEQALPPLVQLAEQLAPLLLQELVTV